MCSVDVKRHLDEALASMRLNRIHSAVGVGDSNGENDQLGVSTQPVLDSMVFYDQFWLNNWIDPNMYKRIY